MQQSVAHKQTDAADAWWSFDDDDDDRPAETLQLLRQGHEAPVHVRARGRYLQLPNLSVGWLPGAPPAIWVRRAASGLRDPCSSR